MRHFVVQDILTIPDADGIRLYLKQAKAPNFKQHLFVIKRTLTPCPSQQQSDLDYVDEAVHDFRHAKLLNGDVPLIGFSGSPWTSQPTLFEGAGSSKDLSSYPKP